MPYKWLNIKYSIILYKILSNKSSFDFDYKTNLSDVNLLL